MQDHTRVVLAVDECQNVARVLHSASRGGARSTLRETKSLFLYC